MLQQHMRGMWCQQLPPPDAAGILQIVPHLLVALSSPHRPLRASALATVQTMANSAALSQQATDGSNSAADGGMAALQLGALLASLASAEAAIMADPDAAVQLLADTLAAAPTPGAAGTASGSGSQRTAARRGSARKAPPPAAHDPAVGWADIHHAEGRRSLQNNAWPRLLRVCLDNTAPLNLQPPVDVCRPLQLAGSAAAAAGAALAGLLGELTAPADVTAARVVLRAVAGWQTPAVRLRAGLPLLRAAAPPARSAAAMKAAVSTLAALSISDGGVPPKQQLHDTTAASAVHDELVQLFIEALALYQPEAVAALVAEDESLVQPLADAGWQLQRGQRAEAAERAAARRLSTRELHDVLPARLQQSMYLVRARRTDFALLCSESLQCPALQVQRRCMKLLSALMCVFAVCRGCCGAHMLTQMSMRASAHAQRCSGCPCSCSTSSRCCAAWQRQARLRRR